MKTLKIHRIWLFVWICSVVLMRNNSVYGQVSLVENYGPLCIGYPSGGADWSPFPDLKCDYGRMVTKYDKHNWSSGIDVTKIMTSGNGIVASGRGDIRMGGARAENILYLVDDMVINPSPFSSGSGRNARLKNGR